MDIRLSFRRLRIPFALQPGRDVDIPVGAALGSVLGGQIEAAFGWRAAFQAVGLPGLALALAALALPEPRRGETELA